MGWMKRRRQATGLIDLTGMIPESMRPERQTGAILVMRSGPVVQLTLQDVILAGPGSWVTLLTLPVGFHPVTDMPDSVFTGNDDQTATTPKALIVRQTGRISISKTNGMRHRRTLTYFTNDPMPGPSAYAGTGVS